MLTQIYTIFIQLMTKKLSEAFFGDKKFTTKTYQQLTQRGRLSHQDIRIIFEPYTSRIIETPSKNSQVTLFSLFAEFIEGVVNEFADWQFQKLSSIVEIAAHVFQHSFENWLTKQESFKFFTDAIVRHSLFRPPHSICVFNYEQLSQITQFWLDHFQRYFEYYRGCMSSVLNEVMVCNRLSQQSLGEGQLKEAKVVEKNEVFKLLN